VRSAYHRALFTDNGALSDYNAHAEHYRAPSADDRALLADYGAFLIDFMASSAYSSALSADCRALLAEAADRVQLISVRQCFSVYGSVLRCVAVWASV